MKNKKLFCIAPPPLMLSFLAGMEYLSILITITLIVYLLVKITVALVHKSTIKDNKFLASLGFIGFLVLYLILKSIISTKLVASVSIYNNYYFYYYLLSIMLFSYWFLFRKTINKILAKFLLAVSIILMAIGLVVMTAILTENKTSSESKSNSELLKDGFPSLGTSSCSKSTIF